VAKNRLDFAREYAATDSWTPGKKAEGESNVDYARREAGEMRKALGIAERGPEGIDVVLDATGVEVGSSPRLPSRIMTEFLYPLVIKRFASKREFSSPRLAESLSRSVGQMRPHPLG
jgi:threonine dehydrogenase-like Zn-dependent dehydrogenase